MEFLKKLDLTGMQFLKLIALLIIGLVTLSILSGFFSNGFGFDSGMGIQSVPSMSPNSYEGMNKMSADESATLSVRNASSIQPPADGYAAGNTSEAFEVKEYNARVETRNLDRDCSAVRALKERTDVIFENASEYDRGCNYTFKVEKKSVEEVLGIVKGLDPKELTENSYTIKRAVDDYTSEIQILENKLATLDKTLSDAVSSYENITALATAGGDVGNLAKIIESKIAIIERLTNVRIETSNQLERMNRTKSEALDRLLYTYFTVSMYENTFVDGDEIKSSWKVAVQQFVREINGLVQDLSIGLVALLFLILKYALYFVILLFVIRFGWAFTKEVWGNTGKVTAVTPKE